MGVHPSRITIDPREDAAYPEHHGGVIVDANGFVEVVTGPHAARDIFNVGQLDADGARTLRDYFGAIADRLSQDAVRP